MSNGGCQSGARARIALFVWPIVSTTRILSFHRPVFLALEVLASFGFLCELQKVSNLARQHQTDFSWVREEEFAAQVHPVQPLVRELIVQVGLERDGVV